jgi:hypothetical protein
MRSMVVGGMALALLALALCFLYAEAQVATETAGSIEGTVVDPQGAVIPRAEVTATNESTQAQVSTTTDSDGFYRFSRLPPGSYRVRFIAQSFRVETRASVLVTGSNATRLDIKLPIGQEYSSNIMPSPGISGGAIYGVVTDLQGVVISGVRVEVTADTGTKYKTVTDCSGSYRVVDLASGVYLVQFSKTGFRATTVPAADVNGSRAITVSSKLQVATGLPGPVIKPTPTPVDIDSAAAKAIQGRVTDPNGAAVPTRISAFDYWTENLYTATTDSEGDYRMLGLPLSNYCLRYDAGEWGAGRAPEEVIVRAPPYIRGQSIYVPAMPERVEVCNGLIETTIPIRFKQGIGLHLYAEHNVVSPGSPLWLTVTLANMTEHTIVIPTKKGAKAAFAYEISASGHCGCPGQLGKHRSGTESATSSEGGPTIPIKVPPGGTLTDRVDLSTLMDWNRVASCGPTFEVWVSRFDTSEAKDGPETTDLPVVNSNRIKVAVIPQ